ncbi:peptidase domain-containing ABC transporter [Streptomyces sp. NBC_00525]|uniref:peptidase domain-containing ABC transporter n=1 Tax=Streptomyces sp. NBC_00525 TaxID=2903660 RepID=UPI002E81C74B|nr:peptidase domain-containing ABC transporter [Streptomyces sp. NBC_00525]WUC95367.1 peptidase domain-containing ABC transporter [Streptomyces sp. NBC_00525]
MFRTLLRRQARVPFRQQLAQTECAAACLAMVLGRYGHQVPVAECRERLGPGRDGVGLSRLVRVAEEYGLDVATDTSAPDSWQPGSLPRVAFLARHHLVVVESVTRRGVRLADPGIGRYGQSHEEFREAFGGVSFTMAPGPGFVRRRMPWGQLPLVRYIREFVAAPGNRRLLAVITLIAALLQVLGLALPLATKVAVDRIVPGRDGLDMRTLTIALFGTVLLHGALALLRQLLMVRLRVRSDGELTQGFIDHLWRLPISFFLQRSRGDLMLRVQSVSSTREILTQHLLTATLDGSTLVIYAAILSALVPGYLPVVLLLAALQGAVLAAAYGRIKRLAQRELTLRSEEQGYLVETLDAMVPVRANGAGERVRAHWRTLFDRYQKAMATRAGTAAWVQAAQSTLTVLAPLILLWCGLRFVLAGQMSLGTMLAANTLALSVLHPVQSLVTATQSFSTMRAQIERVHDVLDTPPETPGHAALPGTGPLALSLRGIRFGYHSDATPVLDGVSAELPAGGKLGIVGRTGSGKSTLGLLMLGLLRPQHGEVLLDGVPVRDIDPGELRSGFGAVLQELRLFSGSIRDNLLLGRPDADEAALVRACVVAGLHHDVRRLPMAYDTPVGEGGAALSAGQRQRVALARALIHRPRLLLLDEATSHLDALTEQQVDAALSELKVTRVVISHRLSAIRNADLTLVLDGGRVADSGTHAELLARPGLYRDLFAAPAPAPVRAAPGAPAVQPAGAGG